MSYSLYYQAKIRKHDCWLFVAALRSFEHMVLDRTINVSENIFEFFVSPATVDYFLAFMAYFQEQGIVSDLVHMPNRLMEESVMPTRLDSFTQVF